MPSLGWFRIRPCSLMMMDFYNIHTHAVTLFPDHEIVSSDVGDNQIAPGALYASVGIHPWYLTETNAREKWELLQEIVFDKRVVAIGEAGLDKLQGASLDLQIALLRKEIELSEAKCLPLVIHCVRAFNELLQLKKQLRPAQPWVIHGFRGNKNIAEDLIEHGCYLSFGSSFQEQALNAVPLNRLFVETDVAEEDIATIYRKIAQARGITLQALAEQVKKNVYKVFFKS